MNHQPAINEAIEARKADYFRLSESVWKFAELRFEERQSARLLSDFLEKEGFAVERGICGLETAFSASHGSDGPVIAILGEYDALPGLSQRANIARKEPIVAGGNGHGCGHNLLGVASLAAAMGVRDHLVKNNLPGTVRFYGCPAEEGGGGKVTMVASGAFRDVDIALAWHPSNAHYVRTASSLATCAIFFHFFGQSAHAGAHPHLGRSALDAVELTNVGANYLREHIPSDMRLHYAITNTGGLAPNVVQAEASVRYQLRAPLSRQIDEVYPRLCDVARGAALMTGTRLEIEDGIRYRNMVPNHPLQICMQENLERLGLPAYDEADFTFAREIRETLTEGEKTEFYIPETRGLEIANVIPPFRGDRPIQSASSDVGDVSWAVPTVEYRSAVWAVGSQAHTWQAVAQGLCGYAHKGMLHAGKVLACTAIDLLQRPSVIDAAKAEFQERLKN